MRNLVSKKRRRMLIAGYDLDMSYITDRILAMSFPAESMRAMYRNPLWQVKSALEMGHSDHYKVYNLCAEESYNPAHFWGRVEMYPFDDNHVPSLAMIKLFCESVHAWLSADPRNIAVVHCMAGKGRTGLMVCSYLVYCGMAAAEALQLYADRRTTNNQGVSIASQRRYVHYWQQILSFPEKEMNVIPEVNVPIPCTRDLWRIRIHDTINIDSIFFVISELQEVPGEMYQPPVELAKSCCRSIKKGHYRTNSPWYYIPFIDNYLDEQSDREPWQSGDGEDKLVAKKTYLDYYFDTPLLVCGDLRITFYERMIGGRLFYACFNTCFIRSSLLQLSLADLDKVGHKGKSIAGTAFCVELLFGPTST